MEEQIKYTTSSSQHPTKIVIGLDALASVAPRPFVFLDIETTGLDPVEDRIIQIAVLKICHNVGFTWSRRLNPQRKIHPDAAAKNGMTNSMLEGLPTFAEIHEELHHLLDGCDLFGWNSNRFDLLFLSQEFHRCGIAVWPDPAINCIDLKQLYIKHRPTTLGTAYKVVTGNELQNAHDAVADTWALPHILNWILTMTGHPLDIYRKLPTADLAGHLVWDEDGDLCYNIEPVKGVRVKDNSHFADLMLTHKFPYQTRYILSTYLRKIPA